MGEFIFQSCDLTDIDTRNHILSIRWEHDSADARSFRPDGFSFAVTGDGCDAVCRGSFRFDQGVSLRENVTAFLSEGLFDNVFAEADIMVPTEKASLAPAEIRTEDSAVALLHLNGIVVSPEETVRCTDCGNGRVLILAVNREVAELFEEKFGTGEGNRLRYSHPLSVLASEGMGAVEPREGDEAVIRVYRSAGMLVLTLHDKEGGLCYADLLPDMDCPSLLFLVNRLVVNHKVGKVHILCGGDDAGSMVRTLGHYYRRTGTMDREAFRHSACM